MPFDLSGVEIVGRVLVGGAFLIAALRNFMNFSTLQRLVEGAGLPFPAVTLFAGLVTLAASSLCILTGYFLAWGGLGLGLFIIIATVVFHGFWRYEGRERAEHLNAFLSNTALLGGALLLISLGT